MYWVKGCCSCKTSERELKWRREGKQGERRKVALIVAELSGACVFPWWVIYWCLSGMNRSKAARWQAINHASNQGWQSSNKTENKENQLLPVLPPEKNKFSLQSDFCTITALCLPDQKASLEVIKKCLFNMTLKAPIFKQTTLASSLPVSYFVDFFYSASVRFGLNRFWHTLKASHHLYVCVCARAHTDTTQQHTGQLTPRCTNASLPPPGAHDQPTANVTKRSFQSQKPWHQPKRMEA